MAQNQPASGRAPGGRICHWCDETIRGHVFCSLLVLVLRQELESRLDAEGHEYEWADVIGGLDRLQLVEVEQEGKRFLLRSEVQGTCGTIFRAAGMAVPPRARQALPPPAAAEPDPGASSRM